MAKICFGGTKSVYTLASEQIFWFIHFFFFARNFILVKARKRSKTMLIQCIVLRHRPDLYKRLAWMNLITAGAVGGVAGYNVSVR